MWMMKYKYTSMLCPKPLLQTVTMQMGTRKKHDCWERKLQKNCKFGGKCRKFRSIHVYMRCSHLNLTDAFFFDKKNDFGYKNPCELFSVI